MIRPGQVARWRTAVLASDLTPAVKLLLVVMSLDMAGDGTVAVSHAELAHRLAVSERTVRHYLADARGERWLDVLRRPSKGRPTVYAAVRRRQRSGTQEGSQSGHRGVITVARHRPPLAARNVDVSGHGGHAPATVPIGTPV